MEFFPFYAICLHFAIIVLILLGTSWGFLTGRRNRWYEPRSWHLLLLSLIPLFLAFAATVGILLAVYINESAALAGVVRALCAVLLFLSVLTLVCPIAFILLLGREHRADKALDQQMDLARLNRPREPRARAVGEASQRERFVGPNVTSDDTQRNSSRADTATLIESIRENVLKATEGVEREIAKSLGELAVTTIASGDVEPEKRVSMLRSLVTLSEAIAVPLAERSRSPQIEAAYSNLDDLMARTDAMALGWKAQCETLRKFFDLGKNTRE